MRLFTKDIDKKLFNQYPKGADLEKQFVVAKIFNPYSKGRWYLINSDPNDPNYIWAIVQMGDIVEVGSVSRKELESIRVKPFGLPLERDLHFTGIKALDILNGLKQGKHYKAGGWVQSGVNVTNELRGEDHDDYGTFELYKNGGEVDVKIINSDESYDKSRYEWLIGDFDKDGVNNVDDKKPFTQSSRQTIDSPSISNGINKLLSMKHAMDENMYDFVDELKNISPDKSKIYARTKTPYSILDKLIKKRLSTLTDLIGTTIVTQDKKELDEVKKQIESGKLGKVLELEDMYQNPKQGYRAYHFLIEKNGMPIELQLKTKRQKALNELSHEPYKLGKLDSDKLIKMTEVANKADNGDQASQKQYNDFMQQPDLENSFYKYANGGYMEGGGSVGKGNQEMLRSNVKAIGHHAKEIGSTGGKKEVEAWVVAKSERAATDLSDITHYLDGKQYAKGGIVVTSIKDIPNLKEKIDEGRVTYRGLGMGKLFDDFYNIAGTTGTRIKVDGKEYFVTHEEFDSISRDENGKLKIRFDAPFRKFEEGGMMAAGGEANTSLVIIDKLLSDRDKLESRLFDAKVKENERWNRLGWGSGMRLSKINVSYKRTDSIKEKMQAIDEKLKLMGYDKFPVGRYEKGGGVGEPYDTMTKYQIEKEYKKLNEKRDLLKKKYGTFQSNEVIENEKQIDKIITLLYGKDFSGVGQKFKYANGGYMEKGAMTASQRLKARMKKSK